MAEVIVYGLAKKILEYLGKSAVQEVASWGNARDELRKLGDTMAMIKARLLDAENRYAEDDASDEALREWLRRLRRVLYRADDLFDEVVTVNEQRSHTMKDGNCLGAKQVHILFLRSGPIRFNRKVAREIKSIREDLEAIKSDMILLNLRTEAVQLPVARLMGKRETTSFVQANDVIGREHDKNRIIEALFLDNAEESVSVIPIVGFGGIGKTTLAQIVFNDEMVNSHDFELKKWACVPDIDNNKEVKGKVFKAFTDRSDSGLSLEQLQTAIRETISNKKYLLVLDDIWDESRDRWLDLMSLLRCGKRGSKIIVTTRSDVVAKIVGTDQKIYRLGLLSDDDGWTLFKQLAFKLGQEESNPHLVSIGKEVVRKCGNVPLAIRAIASLLYTKDKENEWTQIRDAELSKREQTGNIDIMFVLKLSYDNLPLRELKQCFAYCALQPKGYKFKKDELVCLWMAQGFINPSNTNDSPEDVGGHYLEELLMRNFFQEPIRGDNSELESCKMHDLVHDLALRVAGDESLKVVMKQNTNQQLKSELRHVNAEFCFENSSWEVPLSFLKAKQLRSALIKFGWSNDSLHNLEMMFSCFTCLRYLKLTMWDSIERVPDCLGKLINLRYLDVSGCSSIKRLPHSITKLWNLQTLNLQGCRDLESFPTGFSKLVKLRHLDMFVVSKSNGVDALANMNLKGALTIVIRRWRDHSIAEAKRANVKGKQGLTKLSLVFRLISKFPTPDDATLFLGYLQPPLSLKVLEISLHNGDVPPCWMEISLPFLLPNLVEVCISGTPWRFLPIFSELRCLKKLVLDDLWDMEYVESWDSIDSADSCSSATYFPSLEYLRLGNMPKLKGWRKVEDDQNHQHLLLLPVLPRLYKLEIVACSRLRSMPVAPRLGSLSVQRIQAKLLNLLVMTMEKNARATFVSELKELRVYGFDGLDSLSSYFSALEELRILGLDGCLDDEQSIIVKESTATAPQKLGTLTKLQLLSIKGFPNLTVLPEFLNHQLPKLEELIITECSKLTTLPDSFCNLTKLRLSNGSLQFGDLLRGLPMIERLSVTTFPTLTALPESIGHLSQLQHLEIDECPLLAVLPDSFRNLTALHNLIIWGSSPDLIKICEKPHGAYWPLIQHVAHIHMIPDAW